MFFRSRHEFSCLVLAIAILGFGFAAEPLQGADVQFGQEDQVLTEKVEAPNLQPGGVSVSAGKVPDVGAAGPAVVPQQAPGNLPNEPNLLDRVRRVWSHVLGEAPRRVPHTPPPVGLDDVLLGKPKGPISLEGPGQKEVTATADGPVNIEIYLSTYNPCAMEVHLLDADGTEVYFKGRSLLYWERPDDSSFAPVYFQGTSDPDSMIERKPGDFSPKPNLSYSYDVKQGQRLLIKTGGKALSSSYIRLTGPVQ